MRLRLVVVLWQTKWVGRRKVMACLVGQKLGSGMLRRHQRDWLELLLAGADRMGSTSGLVALAGRMARLELAAEPVDRMATVAGVVVLVGRKVMGQIVLLVQMEMGWIVLPDQMEMHQIEQLGQMEKRWRLVVLLDQNHSDRSLAC